MDRTGLAHTLYLLHLSGGTALLPYLQSCSSSLHFLATIRFPQQPLPAAIAYTPNGACYITVLTISCLARLLCTLGPHLQVQAQTRRLFSTAVLHRYEVQ